jgi:hypothetical protein
MPRFVEERRITAARQFWPVDQQFAIHTRVRDQEPPITHQGKGSCYIEFGAGRIGRVDVDFSPIPISLSLGEDPDLHQDH